jgi:hypothetical protein
MSRKTRKPIEVLLANLLLLAADLVSGGDPGFGSLLYSPSIALAVFFSAYYGRRYGFSSLALAAALLLIPRGPGGPESGAVASVLYDSMVPMAAGVVLVYIFGLIRSGYERTFARLKGRIRLLARENWRFRELIQAQAGVNRELEERVSGQRESITNLYAQVQALNTKNLRGSLDVLLETIRTFARITKGSVWYFDPDEPSELLLAAQIGWTEEELHADRLPLDGSIEGWVFRNGAMFSVRMITQSEQFARMDTRRNIMTLPIMAGRYVWGVVNIEEMPFVKYSLYTEQLLVIIIGLAQPAIEKAVEYEALLKGEETDDTVGLPMYGQLHRSLEEELHKRRGKRGSVSLVVVEVTNSRVSDGGETLRKTIRALAALIEGISAGRARIFRYRSESQIAILFTDLDYDGVSMYCLELISRIHEAPWREEGGIEPEVVIGYAVSQEGTRDPDELMEGAERLLEMQKG